MLLRYSFRLAAEADCIEAAVASVLRSGSRTRDLAKPGESVIGTTEMGGKIVTAMKETAKPAHATIVH